jgi:predicted nicotinamide N-methyase
VRDIASSAAPAGAVPRSAGGEPATRIRLRPVPFVPEIRLHVADDLTRLWARTGGEPPYWAVAWPGGQALARYVLDGPELVVGRRVLDLAAGSGLVGIAAALAGAAAVTATDLDPRAVAAIDRNARTNGVRVHARCRDLADEVADELADEVADVVLAGDVFYDRGLAARVRPVLEHARDRGAAVLVGDPHRRTAYLPRHGFEPVARYRVPVAADLEDEPVKDVTIWRPVGG